MRTPRLLAILLLGLLSYPGCSKSVSGQRKGDDEPAGSGGSQGTGAFPSSMGGGSGGRGASDGGVATGSGGRSAFGGDPSPGSMGGSGDPGTGTGGASDSMDFECEPGIQRSAECGLCGGTVEVCGTTGKWEASAECFEEGVCARGMQQEGDGCGACGIQRRTCLADCSWGEWFCTDEGECTPEESESEEEPCESCGLSRIRNRTCSDMCSWGQWSEWTSCEASTCQVGDVETEQIGCGRCGTASRSRTCGQCGYPSFGNFGACEDEGPCEPGDVQQGSAPCGWCGTQARTRTCGQNCEWGSWVNSGTCQDQGSCDPNSMPQEVSQACGNCNSGMQTAVATCSASCELQVGQWGTCTGQTGCTPGDERAEVPSNGYCGNSGQVWIEYECDNSCRWQPVGNCCSSNAGCNCNVNGCN